MLLCQHYFRRSRRIINPRHEQKLKAFSLSSAFFNSHWINMKQMFRNMLMISCISGTNSLLLSLALLPPRQTRSQYIQTGALVLYKQTALVARGLIRRRPANPIKSPFIPLQCLFEDRKSNKGGGRWLAVCHCCCIHANFCLCTDG